MTCNKWSLMTLILTVKSYKKNTAKKLMFLATMKRFCMKNLKKKWSKSLKKERKAKIKTRKYRIKQFMRATKSLHTCSSNENLSN